MSIRIFLCLTCLSILAAAGDNEGRSFMITSHKPSAVTIISCRGEVEWQYTGVHHPQDAQVLDDGSIFCSEIPGAKHIAKDKTILWEYKVPKGCQNPVAQALSNGRFLVGNEGPCKLLEIDKGGKILHEVQMKTPSKRNHGQFRFCRKTNAGTYLSPLTKDGLTREWAADGSLLREFPKLPMPVGVIRLPNGNTLIGAKGGIHEYDTNAKPVWTVKASDIPAAKLNFATGLIRLKNGDTIIANYSSNDDAPDIIEISPDKKIVWSLPVKGITNVAMVQLLDKDARPSKDVLAR